MSDRYARPAVSDSLPASAPVPTAPTIGSKTGVRFAPLWAAAVLALLVAVTLVGALAVEGSAAPAQDPGPAEEPEPFEEPESTDVPAVAEEPAPADDGPESGGVTAGEPGPDGGDRSAVDAENRRIWLVVGGLLAVAVALTLLTVRYWSQTRPVAVTEPVADTEADGRRERRGRRSRRAVAGADHAAADESWEPRGTGEFDRVVVTPVAARARLSADQRRSAFEAHRRR